MAKKKSSKKRVVKKECKMPACKPSAPGCCAVYGMGLLGALVYYISTATGFWSAVWGIIKALLWPAFLVFHLLKFLGM